MSQYQHNLLRISLETRRRQLTVETVAARFAGLQSPSIWLVEQDNEKKKYGKISKP